MDREHHSAAPSENQQDPRSFSLYENNGGYLFVIIRDAAHQTPLLFDGWEQYLSSSVSEALSDWLDNPSCVDEWTNICDADDAMIAEIEGSDELVVFYRWDGMLWQCRIYPDRMGYAARKAMGIKERDA